MNFNTLLGKETHLNTMSIDY